MVKPEVLAYIATMDWTEERWHKSEFKTCYCVASEMDGGFRERRTIHRPLAPWD